MRRTRPRLATLAATALLCTGLAAAAVPAAQATPAAPHTPAAATGPLGTLTLVTGDQVRFTKQGGKVQVFDAKPAKQRRSIQLLRFTLGADQYVVPLDALGEFNSGRLDHRLFDVTTLVQQGLDDQHADRVKVIVTGAAGHAPRVAVPRGTQVTKDLPRLGVRALSAKKADATALWRGIGTVPAGQKVWLDGTVHASLDQSVPLIGAPQAWQAGYTGQGVKVAVLDTGIHGDHPDLKGKVVATAKFAESPDTDDHVGHGTHVASTITGSGAASGGRYKGVAPGVRLLSGKVLDDNGGGDESWILAGMDWAVQQGAKVVSMSLGGGPSDGTDILSAEVNKLSADGGPLFVVAAGNFGGAATVSNPASADAALAVASTTKQDELSVFSSHGPRPGNFGLKPEIAAPGSDIVAARAPGTLTPFAVDANYARISGTSMATPHVAGAAAILASEHPDWTGRQLKAALMDSAKPLPGLDVFAEGAGRVDVAAAVAQQVRTLTPSAGVGEVGAADQPVTRKVGYANDSDAPVTLNLALATKQTGGSATPAGLFTVNTRKLTVPAHGTADATVTVTPGARSTGAFAGTLTATAAHLRLITPVAARVLAPTHKVTVKAVQRSGEPAAPDLALAVLQNEATGESFETTASGDDLVADVPAGNYRVLGDVIDAPDTYYADTVTEFATHLTAGAADTSTTIDARQGKPVTASVDDPTARPDDLFSSSALMSSVDGSDQQAFFVTESNAVHQYVLSTQARPGLSAIYIGTWGRPYATVTGIGGAQDYEAVAVLENYATLWQGDVTAPLVDIGRETDPAKLPDVSGKVVLISPPTDGTAQPAPSEEELEALLTALKAKGAKVVLSFDYIARLDILPVLQLFNPNDILALRDRIAAGNPQVHVVGRDYSPYAYFLYDTTSGALPSGKNWHFDKRSMATVDTTFRSPDPYPSLDNHLLRVEDPKLGISGGLEKQFELPGGRVDYYSPGVQWGSFTGFSFDEEQGQLGNEEVLPVTYRAGQHATGRWGTAPFGPRLPVIRSSDQDGKPDPWAYRQGDKVFVNIPVFNGADPSHWTYNLDTDTGSTTLLRNGAVVDTSDVPGVGEFDVPADGSTYKLVTDGTRTAAAWPLSPKVHAEWTFGSATTSATERTALDLLDLGFDLPLDRFDAAKANAPVTGTVTTAHQGGAAQVPVTAVTADVSYDDGRTWQPATTARHGGQWTITIPPGGAAGGFATVRASATDAHGNAFTETITRAYALN